MDHVYAGNRVPFTRSCGFFGETCWESGATRPFIRGANQGPQTRDRVQIKRFKVTLSESGDSVSLDGEKFSDLIRQCNDTVQLGFHNTYGIVLVMVDGRGMRNPTSSASATQSARAIEKFAFPSASNVRCRDRRRLDPSMRIVPGTDCSALQYEKSPRRPAPGALAHAGGLLPTG